jgi:hypothetical protein
MDVRLGAYPGDHRVSTDALPDAAVDWKSLAGERPTMPLGLVWQTPCARSVWLKTRLRTNLIRPSGGRDVDRKTEADCRTNPKVVTAAVSFAYRPSERYRISGSWSGASLPTSSTRKGSFRMRRQLELSPRGGL